MGRNYKNIDFNCKEDYLFAFYILITQTYIVLKRYNRYQDEFCLYMEEIMNTDNEYIDTRIYEEWQDKFLSVSRTIIKYFVDEASTGFSYVMFRKYIKRSEYDLGELNEDIEKELRELRDVRNWTFHFAQSDIVAIKESFYKQIPKEMHPYIEYNFNPIKIGISTKTSKVVLESLFLHNEKRIKIFQKIFDEMIRDYEKLYGQPINIIEISEKPQEFLDESFITAQLSMTMQKRKYNGTIEDYESIFRKKE